MWWKREIHQCFLVLYSQGRMGAATKTIVGVILNHHNQREIEIGCHFLVELTVLRTPNDKKKKNQCRAGGVGRIYELHVDT